MGGQLQLCMHVPIILTQFLKRIYCLNLNGVIGIRLIIVWKILTLVMVHIYWLWVLVSKQIFILWNIGPALAGSARPIYFTNPVISCNVTSNAKYSHTVLLCCWLWSAVIKVVPKIRSVVSCIMTNRLPDDNNGYT